VIKLSNAKTVTITLPQSDVFEDAASRLLDVDADGSPEVVVVQSNARLGTKLAIYDETGLIELAYIDRPYLAKTLMIWWFEGGKLRFVSELAGYTNHRIGERDIAGGIRTCSGMPEMIVERADWSEMAAITFDAKDFVVKTIVGITS
jgi:hypothetical protein